MTDRATLNQNPQKNPYMITHLPSFLQLQLELKKRRQEEQRTLAMQFTQAVPISSSTTSTRALQEDIEMQIEIETNPFDFTSKQSTQSLPTKNEIDVVFVINESGVEVIPKTTNTVTEFKRKKVKQRKINQPTLSGNDHYQDLSSTSSLSPSSINSLEPSTKVFDTRQIQPFSQQSHHQPPKINEKQLKVIKEKDINEIIEVIDSDGDKEFEQEPSFVIDIVHDNEPIVNSNLNQSEIVVVVEDSLLESQILLNDLSQIEQTQNKQEDITIQTQNVQNEMSVNSILNQAIQEISIENSLPKITQMPEFPDLEPKTILKSRANSVEDLKEGDNILQDLPDIENHDFQNNEQLQIQKQATYITEEEEEQKEQSEDILQKDHHEDSKNHQVEEHKINDYSQSLTANNILSIMDSFLTSKNIHLKSFGFHDQDELSQPKKEEKPRRDNAPSDVDESQTFNQFSSYSFGSIRKKIDFSESPIPAIGQQQQIQLQPFIINSEKQDQSEEVKMSRSSSISPKNNRQVQEQQFTASDIIFQNESPSLHQFLAEQKKPLDPLLEQDELNSQISSVSNMSIFKFDQPNIEEEKGLIEQKQPKIKLPLAQDIQKASSCLGIPKPNKIQMQIINAIYKETQNISKIMLNQSGKNMLYQILALLDDDLPNHFIIVVTTTFLPLRLKMNKSVSWACVNSLMGADVLVQVQNLLVEQKINLLFIQQEYLLQENMSFLKNSIKMIFFEDSTDKISEIISQFKIYRYHLFHTTGFRTKEHLDSISQKYSLHNLDNIVNLYGFNFANIHWTFETEKEKSFINFIRKNNLKKVIMFIDRSKKIDEIVSSFNQKGLKILAYNPTKLDSILQQLGKDSFEILCCYNGQIIPKSVKYLVQYYIHYHLPRNVLSYLSDMNGFQFYHLVKRGIPFDKFSCGFLTEQDFFEIRSAMIQDFTEKKLLNILMKTLNGITDGDSNSNSYGNSKRKTVPKITDECFFNVVLNDADKKIQDHYNNLMNDSDKYTEEDGMFSEDANVKHILLQKFSTEHCIKRELLLKMLSYLSAEKVQIMPFTANLQITQKQSIIGNKIINVITKNNPNKQNVTFSVLECSQELEITSHELNKALKKLSAEKKIQYEIKEEVAIVALKPNIEFDVDSLYEQIHFQEEKQILELDAMYLAAKLTCNLTLEQVFKYQKYKEVSHNSNSEDATFAGNLKAILENYLNHAKATQELALFSSQEKQKLPFISLKSQREKSNLEKDILSLLPRINKAKQPEFQLNRDFSLMDFEAMARFMTLILQGIDGKNINEFKPALQFKKYFRFNYFDVFAITNEFLETHYQQLLQTETSKKIKI